MADQAEAGNSALMQTQTVKLSSNPILRQLMIMVTIAASVALGVAVVLWSQTPTYSLLYGNLSQKDAGDVVAALEQANIQFKVDNTTGAVMVASKDLHQARLKLAGDGLPRGDGMGFELLQQDTGLGTSRAVEAARFHRALEGELARTISTLATVQSARVHLATPKQSVFVRQKKLPSASVVLKLYSGRRLEKPQVASIVHLVAASVPELEANRVTVVDQKGTLLSSDMDVGEMMLTANQFEYTRTLEEHYRKRVEDILIPFLGEENIRAQVTAEVDFTMTEQTAERFNPDLPALRSEQVNEESSKLSSVQGVPGAISNQPPAAGTAPQTAGGQAGAAGAEAAPLNSSKRATRNYELDKTISHTRLSASNLKRLSVAVVVDNVVTTAEDGTVNSLERTPEEVSRISELVKEAIGYSARRGDSVRVVNAAFQIPEPPESLPEIPIWEEPWVWDIGKQAGGLILALVLIFVVLMPTLKKLIATPGYSAQAVPAGAGAVAGAGGAGQQQFAMEGGVAVSETGEPVQLPGPAKYEDTLDAARQMVNDDPKRVAQVVKSWVADDA
ncbi:MAG: flagellar basal body M-ring protein FliF [Gammaproteobacteria bacterium]|nr:flagellar basal body M-ring protein FliF [Gammaproteobacteria bacterium]